MLTYKTGTDFTFNIVEQLLSGRLDGVSFTAHAVSGGRAGSKLAGVVNPLLANNPFATGIKKAGRISGGTIVMGKYRMRTHESRAHWIRLEPFADNNMKGRDGFAIHGRGKRGSDGCIVPTDFSVVKSIHTLLAAREAKNLPAPTLAVVAVGDIDSIEGKIAKYQATA